MSLVGHRCLHHTWRINLWWATDFRRTDTFLPTHTMPTFANADTVHFLLANCFAVASMALQLTTTMVGFTANLRIALQFRSYLLRFHLISKLFSGDLKVRSSGDLKTNTHSCGPLACMYVERMLGDVFPQKPTNKDIKNYRKKMDLAIFALGKLVDWLNFLILCSLNIVGCVL
ncbi:secreted effector protein SifB [Striga asiatica]|uniref:Secreted effector protein SifB n=1 Tax=Striga asiatica TaxID=4170 RepID=A0A5A7P4J7_STRAF|nr:secreted effector protein SifB [Striga asiatica]